MPYRYSRPFSLREWVYLMGMQKITNNESSEAIRLSLLMAKFCKKIALNIPNAVENAESFYLMGLLSMVVFGGDRALAQVLDEFPLTDDIKRGLLRRGGIYSDVFEMAMLYINADWERFDEILAQYSLRSELVSDLFVECTQEIEKVNIM